ncbi:hypothetical protein GGX14DRAFT_516758 [Mycena pura]|uniref:CST complex subunit STN1 n=1 Tax=Mycena pura TaxID=153505 RepID=A0AAD6YGB8_9AGAR|nr:hypothetical protein GGX14DRAFT_516758 [Mycena pura]
MPAEQLSATNSRAVWQWTLTPDAVAPCFVQDVFDMRADRGTKDSEFYWLGRVPCRSVKLVGLLVGVQTYEARIVYSLDDGTAVIECHWRPPSPNKAKTATKNRPVPLPDLQPIASVGTSVALVGHISPSHESRKIILDSIVRCPSANDEPNHWVAARALHRTHYWIDEPFVIPPRRATQPPTITTSKVRPASPSSSISIPSSPVKSQTKSPHKLRHPSRLRTRDLTDNAFRIYLKHYMDNADDLRPVPPDPVTPTRSSRIAPPPSEETPRPPPSRHIDFAEAAVLAAPTPPGFTISYLRRVPALALMAKLVVKAEAERRARAARKAAREARAPVPVTAAMRRDQEKLRPRMKRLFLWAVLQLVKDGDLVSWDGPRRPCTPGPGLGTAAGGDTSALWRFDSTAGGDSTMFSNASTSMAAEEDDEDGGELTDPAEDEEAFVPLTSAFLATGVERAVAALMARARDQPRPRDPASHPRATAPVAGPTARDVTEYLRRSDDMWRNLSEFAVQEALELLQDDGRAWTVGGGRWELTV